MEYRILDTFIWCHQKNRAPRPGPKYLLTVYGYHININFHHISYPKEGKSLIIYMEFCKVMLNQSVSQIYKKQLSSHGGKFSQIIIITNIEI